MRILRLRAAPGWTVEKKAGFDHLHLFHSLRHTAVTSVYRQMRDLFLAQRFARHASPFTTTAYSHPRDEEVRPRLRQLAG